MQIIKNYFHIGLKEPICVLHASDTHITFADNRDIDRKIELSKKENKVFATAEENLEFLKEKASKEQRTIIYTGDLIDFVSEMNFEKTEEFCKSVDIFMSAGNHEFSHYLGEAKEDADYRNISLARVQHIFKNDIRCSSRIIGGVNFVAIDNSYYLFEQEQLDFLKRETEKEYPVILCVHIPLYTRVLYDFVIKQEGDPAYLMSVPEELMQSYTPDRYEQQKQDSITADAFDFIVTCKNIKGILSGHLHKDFEGMINDDTPQLTTGCSTIREIYID